MFAVQWVLQGLELFNSSAFVFSDGLHKGIKLQIGFVVGTR